MSENKLTTTEGILEWAYVVESNIDRGRQGILWQLEQERRVDAEETAEYLAECVRIAEIVRRNSAAKEMAQPSGLPSLAPIVCANILAEAAKE